MRVPKTKFPKLLRTPITLADAKPSSLAAQLGADIDELGLRQHLVDETKARLAELDKHLRLDSASHDVWEQRAKALIAHEFDLEPTDPQWWRALALKLARSFVPGFSVRASRKKRGRPVVWSDLLLAQLYADVQLRKKLTGDSDRKICWDISKLRPYRARWAGYDPDDLRVAYGRAKKRIKNSVEFYFYAVGGKALIPDLNIKATDAAIERHSVKAKNANP